MSATTAPVVNPIGTVVSASWADLPAKAHSVQFYSDDSVLLEGLGRFVGGALGAGDAAVVIATGPHRSLLCERLEARGLDLASALNAGRLVMLDAADTLAQFTVNGSVVPKLFRKVMAPVIENATAACKGGSARIAAFGEMVALLWSAGKREQAVELERQWNELAKTHAFHLRCAYPIGEFDQAAHVGAFRMICSEHSHVLPTDSLASLPNQDEQHRLISEWQQKAIALEHEVGERKKAEQALRDSYQQLRISEERLRLTQRAARIGTWELDIESDEFACSEEACEMLGFPKEAALNKQLLLNRMSYLGDRENFLKTLWLTIQKNRDFETEFRVPHHDGVALLSARGKMFFNQGRPLVIGVLIDISDAAKALETHRKESRRRAGSKKRTGRSGPGVAV